MIETVGGRIARLRKEKELSLSQLESRSGVNRVHINKIELGLRRPSAETLPRLARGLEVEESYLNEVCKFELRQFDDSARLWNLVDKRGSEECWAWLGRLTDRGYPQFDVAYRTVRAHRFIYEELVGSIPIDLVIDHTCNNRSCMNPLHMQVTTQSENARLRWEREKTRLLHLAGLGEL